MRELTFQEVSVVSGAENHNVVVIDPVGAIQGFFTLLGSVTKESFVSGSVITGMLAGAGLGVYGAYTTYVSYGLLAGIGAGVALPGLGTFAGGAAFYIGARFGVAAYSMFI